MNQALIILAHQQPFRIGAAEVRPATRELVHGGQTAIVEPRVMQVLVALHSAKGAVVSKDDLVTSCWDGRIVGDDAINRVIGRLRHEASAHAGNVFRVETITRVGYRLVEQGASSASTSVDRRRLIIAGTAAAAAAGAGAIGWEALRRPGLSGQARILFNEARTAMRDGAPDQVTNAVAKLQAASQLAPKSAEVWGLLALAYRSQVPQIPGDQRSLTKARSEAAAKRALAIDPRNGDALSAQVWGNARFGNWLTFELAARRALQLNSEDAGLNRTLGYLLAQVGRLREALLHFDRSVEADPLAVFSNLFRISTLWDVGRLEEAERALDQAFQLWPRHYAIWFMRYYFLMFNGRPQDSLAMIHDVASRPVGIPTWNLDLTELQAEAIASRDPAKIDEAVAKWREAARFGTGFAENAAVFAGRTGRLDDVLAILDAYYFDRGFRIGGQRWSTEQGYYASRADRHTYFLFNRGMEALHRDSRFGQLTRAIGLDDYWRRSGSRPDYLA